MPVLPAVVTFESVGVFRSWTSSLARDKWAGGQYQQLPLVVTSLVVVTVGHNRPVRKAFLEASLATGCWYL
jgi:hypothetical protein